MVRFAVHYFLLFALMGTIFPYLQLFLAKMGFSESQVGFLQGLIAFSGICGPMLLGWAADRFGKRRAILMASLVAFVLVLWPLSAAGTFVVAALLAVPLGAAYRTPTPLTDALAAQALPDFTTRYGQVRVWGSIGFIVTLAVLNLPGLNLVDEDSSISMVRCMAVAAGLCLVSAAFLPDRHRRRPAGPAAASTGGGYDWVFWLFIAAAAAHQFAMAAYYSFFSLYLKSTFAMSHTTWVWALGAAAEMPLLFFGGRVIKRLGPAAALMLSCVAAMIRLAVYAALPPLAVVLAAQVLHAGTFALFHLASIEVVRRKVPPARRALGMALYVSLSGALPIWVGSSLGGVIVERWGYSALYGIYAAVPLLSIACLAVIVARVGTKLPQRP